MAGSIRGAALLAMAVLLASCSGQAAEQSAEIGTDPVAIRDFAQAAEALGYSHLITSDHVLGAVHEGREAVACAELPFLFSGGAEDDEPSSGAIVLTDQGR